jgi:hypothetical protein
MADSILTQERLRDVLSYDPETGIFQWRSRLGGRQRDRVGCWANGRLLICIDYKTYFAHRLAWFYMIGVWPEGDIDHIDNNPANNRFNNLRECTRAQNLQNTRKPRRDNKRRNGLIGASRHKNKWIAQMTNNYKTIYLGLFNTAEEAHAAYVAAKRKLHPFSTL